MTTGDVFALSVLAVGCIACALLGLGLLGLAMTNEETSGDVHVQRLPLTPPPRDRTAPSWIRQEAFSK
ncbi:MAG: hypothetical protein IPL39_16135 [Opitutaceae bacterium]|nr:hypothetical protein [Opitutaceae bacterium]